MSINASLSWAIFNIHAVEPGESCFADLSRPSDRSLWPAESFESILLSPAHFPRTSRIRVCGRSRVSRMLSGLYDVAAVWGFDPGSGDQRPAPPLSTVSVRWQRDQDALSLGRRVIPFVVRQSTRLGTLEAVGETASQKMPHLKAIHDQTDLRVLRRQTGSPVDVGDAASAILQSCRFDITETKAVRTKAIVGLAGRLAKLRLRRRV